MNLITLRTLLYSQWTVNGGVGAVGHTTPLALLHVGRGRSDTKGNVTVIAQVPKMAAVAATVRVMNTSTGAVTDLVVQVSPSICRHGVIIDISESTSSWSSLIIILLLDCSSSITLVDRKHNIQIITTL